MWRKLRIAALLVVLATVAQRTWLQQHDLEWNKTLYVALYPVNMDGSEVVRQYIASLQPDQFEPIAEYLQQQAADYQLALAKPFAIRLGPVVNVQPPQPPRHASMLETISWSLRFRWWAYRNCPPTQVQPDIKLYLLFYDPAQHPALPHSTALSKGRVGLVNVYAQRGYQQQNAVIIAHELLHTVGATDKYDLATNLPAFPEGFADALQLPLYPQRLAELMAGRRPLSQDQAEIPADLGVTMLGSKSAQEIGWIKSP